MSVVVDTESSWYFLGCTDVDLRHFGPGRRCECSECSDRRDVGLMRTAVFAIPYDLYTLTTYADAWFLDMTAPRYCPSMSRESRR